MEKIDLPVGSDLVMSDVRLALNQDGKLICGNASVKAEVISQERDQKLIVFKKRRRKNYRKKNGHRQHVTIVRVKQIVLS